MPYDPPPDLASLGLADVAALMAARKLPPLESWNPTHQGDSAMAIDARGRWWHEGGLISRPAMVRAFSTLLMRDAAGQHWLVTPAEKLTIAVEDAAFQAVDVARDGDALIFRLDTDEFIIAGPDHPLIARGSVEAPALYLGVRHGCEARINRSTWAQLAEMALEEGRDPPAISSMGRVFPLTPA